jgi:hypothetical protein
MSLRWRRYVPPKRRFKPDPHGATTQKIIFFRLVILNGMLYNLFETRARFFIESMHLLRCGTALLSDSRVGNGGR